MNSRNVGHNKFNSICLLHDTEWRYFCFKETVPTSSQPLILHFICLNSTAAWRLHRLQTSITQSISYHQTLSLCGPLGRSADIPRAIYNAFHSLPSEDTDWKELHGVSKRFLSNFVPFSSNHVYLLLVQLIRSGHTTLLYTHIT